MNHGDIYTPVIITPDTLTTLNGVLYANGSVVSGITLVSNAFDNRILTSTGSLYSSNAEDNLTFDGSLLTVSGNTLLSNSVSGTTILDIQGSSGQLFSVTDSLVGDILRVSDISGMPLLTVNSGGYVIVDGYVIATRYESTVGTGTAPLTVSSTTVVTNLNVDLLDGYHASVSSTGNTIPVRDANENIDAVSVSLDFIDLNVNTEELSIPEIAGRIFYNESDDTINIVHQSGVVQQVGQEFFMPPTNNNSGEEIPNGYFVMATSSTGDRLTIAKAITDGSVDPMYMIGVATRDIAIGSELGKIVTNGYVRSVNTDAWVQGTVLYPDPTTPGWWTDTKPTAPAIKTPVAMVIKQNAYSGILLVRMTNGSVFGSTDSNVEFENLDNGDTISYVDGVLNRWENNSTVKILKANISNVPLSINSLSGHTVNLQEWKVDNTLLSYVTNTGNITGVRLVSTVTGATAPFIVSSSQNVSNLNSDLLDGYHASSFSLTGHTHYQLYQPNGSNPFVYTDNSGVLRVNGNFTQTGTTSLGIITGGTWNSVIISPQYGGTGINNDNRTLTLLNNSGTLQYILSGSVLIVDGNSTIKGINTGDQDLSGFVPYNGATEGLNLGLYGITGETLSIKDSSYSFQENLDINNGVEVVAQLDSSKYSAVFFDYVIKKQNNMRAGTVMVVNSGTSVEYNEYGTNDIGDTSDVILSVDLYNGYLRLLSTTTTDNWIIRTIIRGIDALEPITSEDDMDNILTEEGDDIYLE